VTAWRQVGALIGLRWRLVRSRPVKLGLLAGLATVPLLAWLIVAGSGAVEPEAYTAAITAAGAAYLGFGMLALIAPLTAGGGTELLPPDQLVAYPVRPATQFLASLVLAPLNPWRRDDDYRIGILRFQAAATFGYGSYPGLVRTRLGQLDGEDIGGTLTLLSGVDAIEPVATQGHA